MESEKEKGNKFRVSDKHASVKSEIFNDRIFQGVGIEREYNAWRAKLRDVQINFENPHNPGMSEQFNALQAKKYFPLDRI